MHKLGIQVLPSPDMTAITGAKVTLYEVAMLSIGSGDMPAYYTAEELVTGFKKRLAFQLRGIKKNRGSSDEGIWITKRQAGSSCTSPDVMAFMGSKDTLCSVAKLNISLEDTFAHFTVEEFAASLKKTMAFQPRGIKQSRGSSVDIWITKSSSSCTSPDVVAFTDAKGTRYNVAMLNIDLEDTLAYFTVEESGFKEMWAFQLCGIKQIRGSSGEGIWMVKRKPGNYCKSFGEV